MPFVWVVYDPGWVAPLEMSCHFGFYWASHPSLALLNPKRLISSGHAWFSIRGFIIFKIHVRNVFLFVYILSQQI